MKLTKKTVGFLAGSAGLLVVILAVPARRAGKAPVVPVAAVLSSGPARANDATLLDDQRRRAAELDWSRDPFAVATRRPVAPPKVVASGALPRAPVLTGISIYGGDRRAVIDRQVVREGDRLASGYTVEEIRPQSVALRRDQETVLLSLGGKP